MCRCFYKSLPIFHSFLVIYEVICGIVRLGIFFTNINNQSCNYDNNIFNNRTTFIGSNYDGFFITFLSLWFGYRILRLCRTGHHQPRTNCHLRHLLASRPIQRFLLFNCNCPCYIARPKWRFLVRFLFITISIGLRLLAIILYATAPTYYNYEFSSRTQKLSWICAITFASSILTLLLDYYHFRVWWYYVPSCDHNPFYRRYLKKHRRFIPYHLMGANRNEIQLWNEPCALQRFYLDRTLEYIMIFHFNTYTPTPHWSDVPNKNLLTTTYIGFHRTDAEAAVSIAYTDFNESRTRPQMLGFGIYFARSIFHTQFKARRDGAIICAEILMGRVLEIENDELGNVSNTDAWHQTFDTIYYRHPPQPLRDEFCIKTTKTIIISPNLLVNPGTEGGSTVGWKQTGPSAAIVNSNRAFNGGYYPHSGSYCFAGGNGLNGSQSGLIQNVQLLGGVQGFTESQLDSCFFRAELYFYYQTWDNFFMRHGQVEVRLTFRSSLSSILNTVTTGELACKTSNTGWCRYISMFPLPRGTRSIDYRITFIRKDVVGTDIDSYIDDNSLRVL
ncbi:unnamed protein product [Rotaria sp. Silwood1]|nr:unnamed protein product [Rotaria sp. Silwood1]CAF3687581.1 unnamed protein product [Rotaria sp. Silwood1]CAF4570287.1 unnamed protein product [Rotaria sp. Silwood1]